VSQSFEHQLYDDDETGVISDLGDDGPVLVAFGGLHKRSGMGMPPFEFFGLLKDVDCGKVFVRDLDQVFYQGGVRGLGASIPDAAASLRTLLAGRSPVAFVGNSAGGFAALLFGALVGVDRVVAFAPETFVSRPLRYVYRDDRWPEEIAAMYSIPNLERRYLNAKRVLSRDNGRTRYDIYFPKWNKLDARHALRMASHRRLTLHPNSSKSHGVIRDLRDAGVLKPLIMELIEPR
jgi:hypothetical protein